MPAAKKPKPPVRKKPAAKGAKKRPERQLSEKVLASNYFSDQQKLNRKIQQSRTKRGLFGRLNRFRHDFIRDFSRGVAKIKRRQTLKTDRKIRKQAAYLSDLPETRLRRFFHKLHPKKVLRFIFSLRGLLLGFKIIIFFSLLGATALAGIYLYYRQGVPASIANLQSCIEGQTTKYYDRTGKVLLWASKSDFDCRPVKLENVSQHLIDALLITEDRDFYDHSGVKIRAIVRAVVHNFRNETTQGGSTITQQYVKNAVLQDHSRTVERKIRETILALEIERTFEKNEILTAYLNTVSFGSIYSGVEAASQGYFGKSSKDLQLDEAALLVAALPAPTIYWDNPERHVGRQHFVLLQMRNADQITEEQYEEALKIDTLSKVKTSHEQYEDIQAPHFVLEAEKRLTEEFCEQAASDPETPEESCESVQLRGYTVITTLDVSAQNLAEKTVAEVVPLLAEREFDNAAIVAVDVETGKVIAQVGSRNFKYEEFGQTNTVTQQRGPGSAFKIFDYGALIENSPDWGPGSIFYDYETVFNDRDEYTPKNYNELHAGPITMRRALGSSLNIPAIKAMYITGMNTVHEFAYDAGIETKFQCAGGGCGLSSAIGGGTEVRLDELTNAYATFSRGGTYLPLTYIDRVYDGDDKLLRQWRSRPESVFSNETAYLVNDMLADEASRYTQAFNLEPAVDTVMAVKTGTDDDYRNNHIVGYSKSVAMGAWIGHHDEAMFFETDRHTTAPKALMLKTFMEGYHRDVPYEKRNHWSRPAGIQEVRIDLLTGYQAQDQDEEAELEAERRQNRIDFFPSWYKPRVSSEDTKAVTVDTISGKLATICTPVRALKDVEAIKIRSEISLDDPYYDNWQSPILAGLAQELEIYGYTGDSDTLHKCDDQPPQIEIISSPACSTVCPIKISAEAGTHDLQEINVLHNNQLLEDGLITLSERSQTVTYNYEPLQHDSPRSIRGTLTIEVLDAAWYSDSIDVFLEIDGFPAARLPSPAIELLSLDTDQAAGELKVYWDQLTADVELRLSGECEGEAITYIERRTASATIDITGLPAGICEVYAVNTDGYESVRLEFEIMPASVLDFNL